MKTAFRIAWLFCTLTLLAGCASQRRAQRPAPGADAEGWQQAVQALDARQFVIRSDLFYLTTDRRSDPAPRASYDGTISMRGTRGTIHIVPRTQPTLPSRYVPKPSSEVEDDAAVLTKEKSRKNGDLQYELKVAGSSLLITVYRNTNKCFVDYKGPFGHNIFKFSGEISPLTD